MTSVSVRWPAFKRRPGRHYVWVAKEAQREYEELGYHPAGEDEFEDVILMWMLETDWQVMQMVTYKATDTAVRKLLGKKWARQFT